MKITNGTTEYIIPATIAHTVDGVAASTRCYTLADVVRITGDDTFQEVVEEIISRPEADIRAEAVQTIKSIRRSTLDKFPKFSPGVAVVYEENFVASTRYLTNDTTLMKNGMTPEVYLTGMGAPYNLSATQFAQHIINENLRLGPSAYEVEVRYGVDQLAVLSCPLDQVDIIVNAYVAWCDTISGD